jgi:hypothetical protein
MAGVCTWLNVHIDELRGLGPEAMASIGVFLESVFALTSHAFFDVDCLSKVGADVYTSVCNLMRAALKDVGSIVLGLICGVTGTRPCRTMPQ